jgi:hypothetical protein
VKFGDFILVSLCIEKDADTGTWTLYLQTDAAAEREIIECGFTIE